MVILCQNIKNPAQVARADTSFGKTIERLNREYNSLYTVCVEVFWHLHQTEVWGWVDNLQFLLLYIKVDSCLIVHKPSFFYIDYVTCHFIQQLPQFNDQCYPIAILRLLNIGKSFCACFGVTFGMLGQEICQKLKGRTMSKVLGKSIEPT